MRTGGLGPPFGAGSWEQRFCYKIGAPECPLTGTQAAVVLSKHQRCPEGHKEVGSQAEVGLSRRSYPGRMRVSLCVSSGGWGCFLSAQAPPQPLPCLVLFPGQQLRGEGTSSRSGEGFA